MNTTKLEVLSMSILVGIYNQFCEPGKEATTKTFSQRSKAVERINKLITERGEKLSDYELNMSNSLVKKPVKKAEEPAKPAKPAKAKKDKPAKEKKEKGPSIRSYAEELLMAKVSKDADGRPVGYPYEAILNDIREKFPEAKTSVACLRWYAVHMRERGVMPPNRPRATTTSGGDDTTPLTNNPTADESQAGA
jgi:hypothetical protein